MVFARPAGVFATGGCLLPAVPKNDRAIRGHARGADTRGLYENDAPAMPTAPPGSAARLVGATESLRTKVVRRSDYNLAAFGGTTVPGKRKKTDDGQPDGR